MYHKRNNNTALVRIWIVLASLAVLTLPPVLLAVLANMPLWVVFLISFAWGAGVTTVLSPIWKRELW